jgi:hypothetical protein
MPGNKYGLLAFVFLVAATLIIPAVSNCACLPQCSWVSCLSIVRLLDNPMDYRWMGDWDPRFDTDMHTHYCGVNLTDCNARCDVGFVCQECRLK